MSTITSWHASQTACEINTDDHYEIINGKRVELPPMGTYQSLLASLIVEKLAPFVRQNKLGRAVAETLFQLSAERKLQRRPDVAFVSYARWPKSRRSPDTAAWDVIPDLAIEVNSSSNSA